MNLSDTSYHLASRLNLDSPTNSHEFQIILTGKNKKVLEFGPASGYLTKILKERGCTITAIEFNEDFLDELKNYANTVHCIDLDDVPLEKVLDNEKFDVILFGDILEHLKNPQEILKQTHNYLNESGYLVCSIPNIAHVSVRLKLLNGEFKYEKMGLLDQTHLKFFTLDTILTLMNDTGFSIEEIKKVKEDFFLSSRTDINTKIIPQEIVDAILKDPEALVFQYVLRAVPKAKSDGSLMRSLIDRGKIYPTNELQQIFFQYADQKNQLEQQKNQLEQQKNQLDSTLKEIQNSFTWRFLRKLDYFHKRK